MLLIIKSKSYYRYSDIMVKFVNLLGFKSFSKSSNAGIPCIDKYLNNVHYK